MITISIINQKGGVSKTTTTVHLGAYLSKKGFKILLIDSDPQTDLSKSLNQFDSDDNYFDLLNGKKIVPKSINKNLFIIPGYGQLEEAKIKEDSLKRSLQIFDKQFDICLIDCQPQKIIESRMTINKMNLVASNFLLIPVDANSNTITGTQDFVNAIELVKKTNKHLKVLGIFFSRVNKIEVVYKIFRQHLEQAAPELLLKSFIRKDTKLAQATIEGKTIFDYAPKSNSAKDYKSLGNEIIQRLKNMANG